MPALSVEQTGSKDFVRCDCCGDTSRTVWGLIRSRGDAEAAYFVHWALGKVATQGAHLDLIVGQWGDGTTRADRCAVSLHYRRTDKGPAFMVVDASERPVARNELVGRGLRRSEVVGTALAERAFAVADAVWLQDTRIDELRR